MTDPVSAGGVAIALMREALTLLDDEDMAIAADHLIKAIEASEAACTVQDSTVEDRLPR